MVIFLASYLAENREMLSVAARRFMGITIPPLKHFGPLLVVWGAAMMMLVFIRDLGSSLMFFGAFLALLYVATSRISYVLIGLAMFFVGGAFFARSVSHVQDRFDIWLDPFGRTHPRAPARSSNPCSPRPTAGCSAPASASRCCACRDPSSRTRARRGFPFCGSILPEPHTDFIYAVIVSELGLFGGAGLILIYALITARGFKTSVMAKDAFSKLLAAGLTAVFALQTFVIIGGVTKVIPLTGVTLPFVSYGGTSVIANMILIALLLLISNEARKPIPDRMPGDDLEGAPA